jgi:capsular exopolysaccharide synthesis family protein
MNNLEKYLDQVIEQKPIVYEPAPAPGEQTEANVMKSVQRRWRLILLVFIVICAGALPAIWLLVKPRLVVTGTIRIRPVLQSMLTGNADRGEISDYSVYVNTLARNMISGDVAQDVADELAKNRNFTLANDPSPDLLERVKRKLGLSRPTKDPMEFLKQAFADGTLSIGPIPKTEYIGVTMKSRNQAGAALVVNSFLKMAVNKYGSEATERAGKEVSQLQHQLDMLDAQIKKRHDEIQDQAQLYGTMALDSLQQAALQRQTTLFTQRTSLEFQRIGLEATIAVLGQTTDSNSPPEQLMSARKEFVSRDPTVQEMTKTVIAMQRDLMVAKQSLTAGNPELARKQQLLDTFTKSLEDKQKELEKTFEEQMADTVRVANQQRLHAAEVQREQINTAIEKLNGVLKQQDGTTQKIGETNLNVQDLQFNMRVDQQLREQIYNRIKNLEMQSTQRPRIEGGYPADFASVEDNRLKLTAMVVFLALGCSFGLAVLRDKMDKTLQTPDDLIRHVDLPIIGTTTSSRTMKPALFAEHLAGDYQTIRTNLQLLTSGGMPKKLAVCSAGMREGKTTFAVNLATSLAKAGKKVLLVDGDLRKPDVGYMLSLSNGTAGVQEVLLGGNPEDAIHVVPSSGLHVLVANPRNLSDVYELLTSTTAAEQIEKLSRRYDHLIVDTPPVLAFPDALVWAKLTDGVVLISFAGQTTAPELKEAKARFARIRARVLGTVLSNVPADFGLYRSSYGYGYRSSGSSTRYRHRATKKLLLPTHTQEVGLNVKEPAGPSPKQA